MNELLVQDAHNETRAKATSRPAELAGAYGREVAEGVWFMRTMFVNVYFISGADGRWALVDAGLPGFAHQIVDAAAHHFGTDSKPSAIILTHGHFDHVGALRALAERWDVPIYAHPLEFPYLAGRSKYPPADPSVGGGMLARTSSLYPRGPIDVGERLRALPTDGALPALPEWRWMPTPGHSPGHVSLWRERDRTLVAGDAVITTKQESALAVIAQRPEVHGPPAYFTPDWPSAGQSARMLAALEPEVLASGHGRPLRGTTMRAALHRLADEFEERAVPRSGRYVERAAEADASGVTYLPTPVDKPLLTLAAAAAAGLLIAAITSRRDD